MNIRNKRSGKAGLMFATTLTLLLSIAQPAGAGVSLYGMDIISPAERGLGFDQGFSKVFIDVDEAGFLGDSNARVVVSGADERGEISVIEMRSNESTRTHYNFRSNATGASLSATLVTDGAAYALTYNLPAGQILLENDKISVITTSDFSQVILSEGELSDPGNENFALMLNDVLQGSGMSGFNLSMAESLAESELLSLSFVEEQYGKGYEQYAEGGWACAGALTALVAANAALAAAIAATYLTIGAMTMAIAGAVTAVAAAMAAVDMYCLQM